MADGVRFILDKLAALFRRLEDTELFSHDEVRAIVKKVTDSEYTLKRRQLEVADFHTYLKYTISLDKLLVARVKRLEANTSKVTKELHDMLHAIQATLDNHIIYIFDRSVRRFSSEVVLWNDYIAFLQRKEAVTALNAVFGKALSLYPKNEDFWLQASIHELEANGNVHSARVTLQRALRAVPASSKLWLRYFELELWNALRSTERQKALEIVEDYEALQGAPMVVFNHALIAVQDIQAVLEIYAACETVGGEFTQAMQKVLIAKHGQRKEVWQYLAISAVTNAHTKTDATTTEETGNKRKHTNELEKSLATLHAVTDGLEKCVEVLNEGATYSTADDDAAQTQKADYAAMAVSTLHQSVLQAQQLLDEAEVRSLVEANTSVGTASGKKKARKGEKSDPSADNEAKVAAFEKLNAALAGVLSAVDQFTPAQTANSGLVECASVSVAQAVRFEAYVLGDSLALSLADDKSVLNVHQLAAWVQVSVPVLSKHVLKHYQYQLSSSAKSAASVASVEGFCVPLASLLAYLTQHDDKINEPTVQSALNALFTHATALVVCPTGCELLKRLIEVTASHAELHTAAVACLQAVITTTHAQVSLLARADWCEYYVQHALGAAESVQDTATSYQLLATSYQWVDSVIHTKPHLFQSAALASFYEFVLDTTQALLPSDSADNMPLPVQEAVRKFLEGVADKAVEKCPQEVGFWRALEESQQHRGDHKAATHTRWRRDKALSSA